MFHRNPISLLLCHLSLALSVLASGIALGQATTTGNLSGTVTDPSGAVVPNATLVIRNPAVGAAVTQHSNGQGGYAFSDLQVGAYTLTVSAPGFANTVIQRVLIDTGRAINVNPTLKVGSANEQVNVTSDAQVLETTTNTLASTIRPDSVQQLPLSGRDTSPLTQLAPGAQTNGDARYGTFNALPSGAINITVDGMNSNFQKFRTNTSGNYSPAPVRLGAIEEVSVSTSDLTADAGAEGAVALRFQIKRGTNRFHGGGFWEFQSSALNANSFANDARAAAKNKFHYNDEGGNIGGPIFKDKLFFFANYEQEIVPGNTQASSYTLTPAAQQGNITYTDAAGQVHTANVLTVAAANGFPSAINARIAAEQAQINKYNQTSNLAATALPYQNSAQWNYSTVTKNIYPTARIDWQIRPTMDFHVAYDLWWRTLPGTEPYNGDTYTTGAFKSSYQTITAGFDWTITPHMVNQLNAGLLNDQERFNPTNSFAPYASVNNILYTSPTFTNGYALVAPTTLTNGLPEPRNNPVRNVFDDVTWNKGGHTFTFGGDFRNSTAHDLSISNPPPASLGINVSYDPANAMFNTTNFPGLQVTGTNQQDVNNLKALYATLTGRISGISGSNNLNTATNNYQVLGALVLHEAQNVGGLYGQDAWRITPHLALNYGFRWQFSGTIHNTDDIYTSPTLADLYGPSTAPFQPGTLNGVQNPQIYRRPNTYSADLREPAPNVGFAWNPKFLNSNLVVRGGGSISYYDEGWEVWENGANDNPGLRQTASLLPGPVNNTPSTQFAAGSLFLGATPSLNVSPASYSLPLPESNYTFSNVLYAVDPNIRSPSVQNWNLGVQYKVGWDTVVEANYVGNHVVHMWQSYNINEVNIFENGFLTEFQKAQANLAANGGSSFAGSNLAIMNQAFGSSSTAFSNSTYVSYVKNGQAGALANAIATSSTYFCNLVGGANFSPCAKLGHSGSTAYPINFFVPNPYSTGTSTDTATVVSDPGSSDYNGLQLQVKHPVGHGLTLQANYAYSHAFSNRYIGASDTATSNFTTLRNERLNRGPAPTDERHALKTYAVYAIPFHGSNGLVKEIAGGWTVSPVFSWTTGRNFKLQGGTETVNTNDSGVILNGVDVHKLQKEAVGYFKQSNGTTPLVLLNPALFNQTNPSQAAIASPTTAGQFGQFVYLHSPQYVDTDFAVTKYFTIFEALKMNIQCEMINVFNHPNFAVESTGSNSPAQFATITSAAAPGAITTLGAAYANGGARVIQFRTNLAF